MSMSDIIEKMLLEMFDNSDGSIEIRRNTLAERMNCVPSQINYVIQTRFTPERGYTIESRRGGGGSVKIKKVNIDRASYIMHIINTIGSEIDFQTARVFIKNFLGYSLITEREARLMASALSDKSIGVRPDIDKIRAGIFKNMLITLV